GREGHEPEHDGQCERGPAPHRPGFLVNVARTRPATVVRSSPTRTSSAVPFTTAPSRERRTGASVQSRPSAPCHRSTLVSSCNPSLEVSTTFRRISTLLVCRNRSPSSPTIVHDRSRWTTLTAIFLRDERGGHDDCEHGDDAEDQAREAPWICQPGCVGAHQSQHDALMQFRYQPITARRAREGKSADARRFSLAGCRACG